MTDLRNLKNHCNLRLIVEADLGSAHCRGGKALLWWCPFQNEHKGYSLAVWANGWCCFGAQVIQVPWGIDITGLLGGGDIRQWMKFQLRVSNTAHGDLRE